MPRPQLITPDGHNVRPDPQVVVAAPMSPDQALAALAAQLIDPAVLRIGSGIPDESEESRRHRSERAMDALDEALDAATYLVHGAYRRVRGVEWAKTFHELEQHARQEWEEAKRAEVERTGTGDPRD